MGKSKKKIKADQINILRKQYDAFLEEDKKRKERNEHILDKLDKIRLSNTVARYKSNIYLDQRLTFNCAEEPLAKTYHPQANHPATGGSLRMVRDPLLPAELDVLAKPLQETYVINEISKKYILIPKLRSVFSEDYTPRSMKQDNNNDIDWKSKYSILDTLKQNEKEEINQFLPTKKHCESFLDDIPSKEPTYRANNVPIRISSNHEFAEANDIGPTNRVAYLDDNGRENRATTDAEKKSSNTQHDKIPKVNINTKNAPKTDEEFVGVNRAIDEREASGEQDPYQPDRGQCNYPTIDIHGPPAPVTTNIDQDGQQHYVVYSDKHENEDSEKLSPVVDDIRHVEVIDSIKPEAQKTSNVNQNIGNPEKLDYPIDIINVKDFTPAEGVPLVDGVNVNPERQNVKKAHLAPDHPVPKPPPPVDQAYLPGANQHSGIDHYISEPTVTAEHAYISEADSQLPSGDQYVSESIPVTAEHKNNVLENTEQQLPQDSTYDPDTVTSEIEAFEAEQNQMFYNEQANYPEQDGLNDVYSPDTGNYDPTLYYTGVHPEAAYPAVINEHEETTQRYDPSYENQYAGKEHEQYPQQYADQQQYQQEDGQQQYGEQQQFSDQQYTEPQNYNEQQYGEQPYAEQQEQILGESGVITTAQEFVQEPIDGLHEQQVMEQIEQQLDNEQFGVPNQDGGVGDIVDESVLYTQNAGDDVTTTEPYVESESPRAYLENQNPQPSS